MDDKLRDELRLMLRIKLTLLPRWVKHEFWRQSEPANERATHRLVDEIVQTVDETVEAKERRGRRERGLAIDGY